jgi:hypothetical protein
MPPPLLPQSQLDAMESEVPYLLASFSLTEAEDIGAKETRKAKARALRRAARARSAAATYASAGAEVEGRGRGGDQPVHAAPGHHWCVPAALRRAAALR